MENKYYFQTTWDNFQVFISKGYIYPERIHNYVYHKLDNLDYSHTDFDKDNYYLIGNYIPLQDKIFKDDFYIQNKTVIFEFKNLNLNNIIDNKTLGLKLYDGIINFYNINKIYIQDNQRLERYKNMSGNDIYIFSENIITSGLPNLKLVKNKKNIKEIKNNNIDILKDELSKLNYTYGGERLLKFYLENGNELEKYYKYKDNNIDEDLKLVFNFKNNLLQDSINEILIKNIGENNIFDNRILFETFIKILLSNSDLEKIGNNIRNYFNDNLGAPNYNDLFDFDLNKYYGITLYLIFYKKNKLDDFLNFLINNLKLNKEIIYLGIYLYGCKYGYNNLPVELEGKKVKYDIEGDEKYKDRYINGESAFDLLDEQTEIKKELQVRLNNEIKAKEKLEAELKIETRIKEELETEKYNLNSKISKLEQELNNKNKELYRIKKENEDLKNDIKLLINIEKQKNELLDKYRNIKIEQTTLI